MNAPLYNREILALAVALADYPRLTAPTLSGERRAPLCGSRVMLDLEMDADARVIRCGLAVEACALGQAAAALLARGMAGRGADALIGAATDLAAWLRGTRAATPDWPGIAVLAGARAYPARHAAIMLPFALAADMLTAPPA